MGNHSNRLRKVTNTTFGIMMRSKEKIGAEYNDTFADWNNDYNRYDS